MEYTIPIWQIIIQPCIMGGVLFGIYILQKRHEAWKNRKNMARILSSEVKNILRFETDPSPENMPDTRIYDGLLNTGNIYLFDDSMQSSLRLFYNTTRVSLFEVNTSLGMSLIKDLDCVY